LDQGDTSAERVVLAIVFGVVLVAFWPSLVALPGTWGSFNEHGYFVSALVAWLVWRDGPKVLAVESTGVGDLRPVLVLVSIAWMFGVIGDMTVVHEFFLPVLLTLWALCVFGWQSRRLVLPIGLTFFLALPIWDQLVPVLQRLTVIMSGGATRLSGITAEIGYDYIALTSGTLLVEEGCAGLNYLMGGLVLGAFYAHFFVARWQTQLKIVVLAGLVTIVGNWIRVSALVFLAEATQMQSPWISNHLWQGWLIFTLLMIPTYFVARKIERHDALKVTEADKEPATDSTVTPTFDPHRVRRAIIAGLMATSGSLLYMAVGVIPRASALDQNPNTLELVAVDDLTPAEEDAADVWRPNFSGVDERAAWRGHLDGSEIQAVRHYFIDQKQGEELIGYPNAIAPDSLFVTERFVGPMGTSRRIVREAVVRTADRPRVVWYWYRVGGVDTAFPIQAKLLEIISFFRRSAASELITMSVECQEDDCTDAANTLRAAVGVQ
jgi:exosortase